jgi:transcriptional regulator with XRE-family HTH domain
MTSHEHDPTRFSVRLPIGARAFALQLADAVLDARLLVGWTQRELAQKAGTSQSAIWRIERGIGRRDVLVVERVLQALGIRATLHLEGRHLDDRRRQRDPVHARIVGVVARRLARQGWHVATEVPLGHGHPTGWIDILAWRPDDGALLIVEVKTEIRDIGAVQRSLGFYSREAPTAARSRGWRARRTHVLLLVLDSQAVAGRLKENAALADSAFPVRVPAVSDWLSNPVAAAPGGWAIAAIDPRQRGAAWLKRTSLDRRRSAPAYADYADAVALLAGRRGPVPEGARAVPAATS